MMISMAVAALLLCAESVQAQNRTRTRTRTRTVERTDDRYIPQSDPRRSSQRERVVVIEQPAPPARPVRIKVVDNEVIRTFEREHFDSDRLKRADMIFSTRGYMTVAQIVRISESFDFDSNRIKFLKSAYVNCVDRHNYYLVLRTIDFSSSRDKVIDFVLDFEEDRRYIDNDDIYYKVSSADMSAIIKTLKNESFDSARKKTAMMIVSGNLFSSRQIADMAKTFSFDSSRKEFLLYAYPHCVDPQNYSIAADALQFNSSRDELMRNVTRPGRRP